jgi:ribonuclease HI
MSKKWDKYYGIHNGLHGNQVVVRHWEQAQKHIKGAFGCTYRKFHTYEEARVFADTGTVPVYEQNLPGMHHIYTDGSAMNSNPELTAGIGVWFGPDHPWNYSGPLEYDHNTNQRAELAAIGKALQLIKAHIPATAKVVIHTDSMYSINCLTVWIKQWLRNNWKNDTVKNRDLIDIVYKSLRASPNVSLEWVKGHASCQGNEGADQLARAALTTSVLNAKSCPAGFV